MKNKNILLCVLSLLLLSGCKNKEDDNKINFNSFETIKITQTSNTGILNNFDLISPANGSEVVKDLPTFKWEVVNNATSYVLEVCSDTSFTNYASTYIKKANICENEYTLDTYLRNKETTYYWRVSALNDTNKVMCNEEYRGFFLKSPDFGEINFDIEYADEWIVHQDGSQANVSVDKNDFFNNGMNSLQIDFDSTKTNQGIPSSDGWIVVSHSQETELYGVDAFYFNFYYNGQDADIYLRVIDEDNEYYNAQIKLANNAQQTIIIKFDDFTLRTKGGTPVVNEHFDYNYIKAVELVFEQSFGDGVCLISNLKAIKYDDYNNLFVEKFNFNNYPSSDYILDNYSGFTTNVSNSGSTFTMGWAGNINGYGFVKIPVNTMLVNGDSFKVKISHTGSNTHRILFRVIEEDGDRWVYKQDCSTLVNDELIIPFTAFTLSEANGDGARQFYFLKQLQLGIENAWGQGSVTYDNLRVVTMNEEIENLYMNSIQSDGLIENFERYNTGVQMYYNWQETSVNKDESLNINTKYTPTSSGKSGVFTYKSDMYAACYGLQFNDGLEGYNSLKFDVYDQSVLKNATDEFKHLAGKAGAKMVVKLYVTKGETYSYVINCLDQSWTRYNISFNDFTLDEGFSVYSATPLESANIRGLMFQFQYYYYASNGKASPQYTSSNPVYMDNIYLSNTIATTKEDCAVRIKPTSGDANVAIIDDFENYTNDNLSEYYQQVSYDYSKLSLVKENNNQALCMQYKGNSTSVSYQKNFLIDSSVKGKAIILDLKGDGKATVYINLFLEHANTTYKFRYAINNVPSVWTRYTIGFNNFAIQESTSELIISNSNVNELNKITFGIVNYQDYELSNVLVDNIKLTYSSTYTTFTSVTL